MVAVTGEAVDIEVADTTEAMGATGHGGGYYGGHGGYHGHGGSYNSWAVGINLGGFGYPYYDGYYGGYPYYGYGAPYSVMVYAPAYYAPAPVYMRRLLFTMCRVAIGKPNRSGYQEQIRGTGLTSIMTRAVMCGC